METTSEQLFDSIGKQLTEQFGSVTGKMFGAPCMKINSKAFVALYKEQMVFKIGQQEVNLLKEKFLGSENWDPSGKKRPMKDWLQVPTEFSESWKSLAEQACGYVKSINGK